MEAMPTTQSQTRSFTTIFLIEMWERFGFYGMQALIVYYMVQRLEHEHGIKAVVRARNVFSASHDELDIGQIINGQMVAMLDFVHLQRGDAAVVSFRGDGAGDLGLAAAQFQNGLVVQSQQFVVDIPLGTGAYHGWA